jgi:HEPN domain-containing protein
MNRAEWQRLANERIADAKVLLNARRWSVAYYVAGYAVECALKSCILARLSGEAELIFEDKRFSEKCWTHVLGQLLEFAGLRAALDADMAIDPVLQFFWETAKDWKETSRYARKTRKDAEDLYEAIANKKHGVLQWFKKYW